MGFRVTTESIDRLGLVEICQRFTDQQCLPAHMLSHEAAQQPTSVLVKWHDWPRGLLDRVDSVPRKVGKHFAQFGKARQTPRRRSQASTFSLRRETPKMVPIAIAGP